MKFVAKIVVVLAANHKQPLYTLWKKFSVDDVICSCDCEHADLHDNTAHAAANRPNQMTNIS